MLDSDFWRDLADKFGAVDTGQLLRADWNYSIKVGEKPPDVARWRIVGGGRQTLSVQLEFEALARRGGPRIYRKMDSLVGWLETLRQYRLNTEDMPLALEVDPGGTTVAHIYSGSIVGVAHASVDLCKLLESLALETERMHQIHDEAQTQIDSQKVRSSMEPPEAGRPAEAQFPARATWLEQRLIERGWDHNDPPRFNGPDRKTVLKIIAGGDVREDVLEKLARALSAKFGKVNLLEIPRS